MLPEQRDNTCMSILRSLKEDGRKSYRAISREINISTPTVKARYERLVNMGLIKSVKPEIDMSKVDKKNKDELGGTLESLKKQKKHFHIYIEGLKINLKCELCGGAVTGKPKVLKLSGLQGFL